ncbi:MAG: DUF3696 domain-containing protein [Desulfobacteraceae bacterium]|nr:DUF3696 domain-containing protein [Desulfobacteraceae bacterium]MBC2748822.1 DUF3696 domain-containing protein [Desulfobacteraceae bacterium]
MIKQWKLFNFKSVRNETGLTLEPLTIFAGANSSGKSTLLQSILLVAQTLAHKVSSRSVVLNGAFARLGQFDDLRTAESDADQIVIGWTCRPFNGFVKSHTYGFPPLPYHLMRVRQSIAEISCEIAFDAKHGEAQQEIAQIQPLLFSSQLSVKTRDPESGDHKFHISIRRSSTQDDESKRKWIDAVMEEDALARSSLHYDVEIDSESFEEIQEEFASAHPVGCVLRHFLPNRLTLGVDMVMEEAHAILNVLGGEGSQGYQRRMYLGRRIIVPAPVIERILTLADEIDGNHDVRTALSRRLEEQKQLSLFGKQPIPLKQLNEALRSLNPRTRAEIRKKLTEDDAFGQLVQESIRELREGQIQEPAVVPFHLPDHIASAIRYTDQFFSSSLRYLGPLRDEPKSLYPLSATADPSDVGLKGEHTAAVLELHKNRQVRYIPTSAFVEPEIRLKDVRRSLETAVIDWLQYLGVAEHVESRDKGKFGHELTVSIAGSKRPHDLTHVGVGVSQVLPILVTSLLADPDTTLIFEQPELHLHPKVQTRLADFFLSMTQLGKQCLIETHSEYLISRIRFRAAAALKSNPWVEAVKVYFVEKGEQGSSFREVNINEFGAILDWPDGFFDQSQREAEAILRAAASKRRAKKGKQK